MFGSKTVARDATRETDRLATLKTAGDKVPDRIAVPRRPNEIDDVLNDSRLAQSYRQIIARMSLPRQTSRAILVGVTSALYDEGAPSVVLGLATTLAAGHGGTTMVLDCDLGWPTLDRRVGVPLAPGLGEILCQQADVQSCTYQTSLPNLVVLPAGKQAQRGPRGASILRRWLLDFGGASGAEFIVLNLPPLNVDPGAAILATAADAVVLTVLGGSTPRQEVEAAISRLADSKLASVVVNGAESTAIDWLTRHRSVAAEEG